MIKIIGYAGSLLALVVLLSGCNLPLFSASTPDANAVATSVHATFLALTPAETKEVQATPTLEASPTPETPTPDAKATRTKTPVGPPGPIEGSISGYPYGAVPSLTIVAFEQEAPYNYSYFITASGSTYFSMTSEWMIPGTWLVVAYDASGNSGGCPTIVRVTSNQSVTCNITDWAGSYPSKPAGVP